MKIVILCHDINEVDIVTTDELNSESTKDEIEDYIQDRLKYNPDNIDYLAGVEQINNFTIDDFE